MEQLHKLNNYAFTEPVVTYDRDCRLEVFTIASDKTLRNVHQIAPNNGWSIWESFGGNLAFHLPAVGHNADGGLEVFALSERGDLQHISQLGPPVVNPSP
jgi:hypothetical protein